MRAVITATIAMLALLVMSTFAVADEPMAMPDPGPDPLANLNSMLGKWEGEGTSTFGPFSCTWEATRVGAWIVSTSHIFDSQGNNVENVTQVFGANPDASLICYGFDSGGKVTVWTGEANADGSAKFSFTDDEDPGSHGEFWWEMNADGTMGSHFRMHSTMHPEGWPDDFAVDEIDVRVQ